MIRSKPHTVSPRKYYPHPPTSEPGDYFFTPSFCRSHQKYFYRVWVNTLLEALYLGILGGSSAPVFWMNFSASTASTGCWTSQYKKYSLLHQPSHLPPLLFG